MPCYTSKVVSRILTNDFTHPEEEEAEMGGMQPECAEAEKTRTRLPWGLGKNAAPKHLDFGPVELILDFRPPEQYENKFLIFEVIKRVVNLLQKTNTVTVVFFFTRVMILRPFHVDTRTHHSHSSIHNELRESVFLYLVLFF